MAAVDYFLKLEEIPGESLDATHKGEIDVLGWGWGERQEATMAFGGGGGGAGKVQMKDFQFTMRVNKASPKLMLACATGQHIKQAVLTCRKAGKQQQEYLKISFIDLLVSAYDTGSAHEHEAGTLPVDAISLNFAKIQFDYREQRPDGTLGGTTMAAYDLKRLEAA